MPHINTWSAVQKDLQLLVTALGSSFSKNVDFSVLNEIAYNSKFKPSRVSWFYDTSSYPPEKVLTFKNIDLGTNFLPIDIDTNYHDIDINLFISIESNGYDPSKEMKDPIDELNVRIEIEGDVFDKVKEDMIDVVASWHLDREAPSSKYSFIHPLYHLHFGGNCMRKRKDSPPKLPYLFGHLLLLNAPRLKHVPMDAVLATDFVIRNFYEKSKYKKLLQDNNYQIALRNSQERFWKPYAVSFASKWIEEFKTKPATSTNNTSNCDAKSVNYDFNKIFPSLM